MKARNQPNAKYFLALLASLACAPALANPFEPGPVLPAYAKIAQFSPEERRVMRERWEQASPEERLRLRREFQERSERLRPMPPAEIEREGRGRRDILEEAGRFGTGFERRRGERERLDRPESSSSPEGMFDRRFLRDGERP